MGVGVDVDVNVDHVRAGDRNLAQLRRPERRHEVLGGAYFTSGCYRSFVHFAVSSGAP